MRYSNRGSIPSEQVLLHYGQARISAQGRLDPVRCAVRGKGFHYEAIYLPCCDLHTLDFVPD